jgi:hypothetical protein
LDGWEGMSCVLDSIYSLSLISDRSGRIVEKVCMGHKTLETFNSSQFFAGSSGSPYSSFRYMQDIMFDPFSQQYLYTTDLLPDRACKIRHASCGGVTHWALTDDDEGGVMTVAWGQNATNGTILFFQLQDI